MNNDLISKDDFDHTAPPLPPIFNPEQDLMARTWRFAFQGNGMEYFKIWITNLILTIVTLSFYAPWAKVRRLRYFYGNTYLNRRKFDFTGVPIRILYGRLVALGIYALFFLSSNYSYKTYAICFVLIVVIMPWILRSSYRFMARNSKYENGRFYFSAKMGETYLVFIQCALVTILSFGLLFPLALYWFKKYQINHLYVGRLPLKLNATVGAFFVAIIIPMIVFIGLMVTAGMLITFNVRGGGSLFLPVILYVVAMLYIGPFIQGSIFKATWSNVEIGKSQLTTDLSPWTFAWIQVTNSIAMVLSLGLLSAWAKVRIYRYKVESLSVTFYDDPASLLNKTQQDHHAIGEEIADIFDIDISI